MKDQIEHIQIESERDINDTIDFLSFYLTHPLNRNIWKWEFEMNKSVLYISQSENKVIGTQFIILLEFQLFGKPCLTGKTENSYFSESYRGKGLFKTLFQEAENNASNLKTQLLWAFTPATKVYKETLGFKVFDNIIYNASIKIGVPDINLLRNNKFPNSIIKTAYHWSRFLFFKYKIASTKSEMSLNAFAKPTNFSDVNEFYNRMGMDKYLYLPITDFLFDWRIIKNPNLSYLTKFFYKDKLLKGYYIIALDTNKNANITDFMFDSEEVGVSLLKEIHQDLKVKKVSTLNYMGNINNKINQKVFKLLSQFGSNAKLNDGMPFVYKSYGNELSQLNDISSSDLYINGLWTEGFHY